MVIEVLCFGGDMYDGRFHPSPDMQSDISSTSCFRPWKMPQNAFLYCIGAMGNPAWHSSTVISLILDAFTMMCRCWWKKWSCGYNGRYDATHTINRDAVYTDRKSVKNGSSDYVVGRIERRLMAIEVLCIVEGIGGGVVCWVKKKWFFCSDLRFLGFGASG